jgi:hypothetical protein
MRKFLALCAEAFRHGYEQARAEARAKAQPPLGYFAGLNEAQIMTMIELAARRAHAAGAQAERTRIAEILKLPGAHRHPRLAASLALAEIISADQAAQALAVAESDALTPPATESSPLESDGHVLH